ncbi:MAG TPA: class II aldolase/adducin family protein [Roseiflexaceae bacterium]|nr:class II aldolase/adducin family protein [Roseiflexaceae bacterium]
MTHDTPTAITGSAFAPDERLVFGIAGDSTSALVGWFATGLREALIRRGHEFRSLSDARTADADTLVPSEQIRLVINQVDLDQPRPVRRSGQGTFVVTVVEGRDNETELMKAAYPVLVRSLSNMAVYNTRVDGVLESHFITPEQGHYVLRQNSDDATFFDRVFERIQPLACSHLVINNDFVPDLPDSLWEGTEETRQISWAGRQLDSLGLLPAAIPLADYLSERDMRHIKRLYGIGGLSYGNLSARAAHDPSHFWMSASGVDKSRLQTVGRDILLVTGYSPEQLQIRLSVPPEVEPRRVSVDAIEHYMIYREHPEVGAIVHIHAWWSDPIVSTQVNYPCGTYELAAEVAELVRQAPDPSRAVIGLKNHGLTITGHSIAEIFQRIEGKILPQVPMS